MELVVAQDQCQSNILWIGSAPPNWSTNIRCQSVYRERLLYLNDQYNFKQFKRHLPQKRVRLWNTWFAMFFAPVVTVTVVHFLLKRSDLFPLLSHSRAWLPPSTGSRSPAQEVHKYAPKNTNGKPPLAVESLGRFGIREAHDESKVATEILWAVAIGGAPSFPGVTWQCDMLDFDNEMCKMIIKNL